MLYAYKKQVTRIEIPNITETPEEILELIKKNSYHETLISNSFFIEDNKGIILTKQKIIYDNSPFGKICPI